jgi:hypothetical protein
MITTDDRHWWSSVSVAREHRSNAGLALDVPPALSTFLASHQGAARYEVASSTVFRASPLIVRDARPVLMLTSYHGRPLLSAAALAGLVSAGEVRYILLGRGDCAAARRSSAGPTRMHATSAVPRRSGRRAHCSS